jgi:hypothetical protein
MHYQSEKSDKRSLSVRSVMDCHLNPSYINYRTFCH